MAALRLKLDGVTYNVFVEYDSLERSFEIVEGSNAGDAINGRAIRDIIGTSYKYDMTIRADPDYPKQYDALFYALSAPVDTHTITLPFGQESDSITFEAKISSGKDKYKGMYAGYKRWDEMSLTIEPMEPQRRS